MHIFNPAGNRFSTAPKIFQAGPSVAPSRFIGGRSAYFMPKSDANSWIARHGASADERAERRAQIYRGGYRRARGMGAVDVTVDPTKEKPWWGGLAEQALAIFQSERLRAENKRRIDAGLPPLTAQQAAALAPTANVNVAIPPMLQYGLIAGGAAIIFLLATQKRGR